VMCRRNICEFRSSNGQRPVGHPVIVIDFVLSLHALVRRKQKPSFYRVVENIVAIFSFSFKSLLLWCSMAYFLQF